MSLPFTIVLKHIGGERKTLEVEYVAPNASYLSIRWGQSGIYDLNLLRNVLTARSQKAQARGKAYWSAEDIDAVRKMARDHLASVESARSGLALESRYTEEKAAEAMRKHTLTMPKFREEGEG